MSTDRRELAFQAWCLIANYDATDRDSPHAEAFFAGYDRGFSNGWDDGESAAAEDTQP